MLRVVGALQSPLPGVEIAVKLDEDSQSRLLPADSRAAKRLPNKSDAEEDVGDQQRHALKGTGEVRLHEASPSCCEFRACVQACHDFFQTPSAVAHSGLVSNSSVLTPNSSSRFLIRRNSRSMLLRARTVGSTTSWLLEPV